MELRKMGMEQMGMITEAFLDIFTAEPWNDDWSDLERLRRYILGLTGNADSLSFGLFDGEALIGISLGSVHHWSGGAEYWIDEFGIRPKRQGQGAGTAFLRLIEERIRLDGMNAIMLMTDRNVPAYRFYQKNGFEDRRDTALFTKCI